MSTNVLTETLVKALNEADPNRIGDALRAYGLGMHLSPQKYTWVGTTGATAVVFTTTAFLANASAGAKTPPLPASVQALPPALDVATLRVTTGPSGSVGSYNVLDASATAQPPYPVVYGSQQKWSYMGTTGTTAQNLTASNFISGVSNGINGQGASPGPRTTLPLGGPTGQLPAILSVATLRVTTGPSGSLGYYNVVDANATAIAYPYGGVSGATAAFGTALLSDDGSTLIFPAAVSGFVIEYLAAIPGQLPGTAVLSDDGTTLTFPAQVSGFVVEYVPRSNVDVTAPFEHA